MDRTIQSARRAREKPIADLETRSPLLPMEIPALNPFLLLAHHGPQIYRPGNRGLPFDAHPHRGFETVTFILAGALSHIDSAGYTSTIGAGGVQWMTAGAGVVHNEVAPPDFRRDGGPLELMQLWVNLPAALKLSRPAYVGLQEQDIPQVQGDDGKWVVRLISGRFGDALGPIVSLSDVSIMLLLLEPGASLRLPAPQGRRVFFYVVGGDVIVNDTSVARYTLVQFNDDGDDILVACSTRSMVLFGHADPIDEPIVAHGPFVMNSQQEIVQAFKDYSEGAFA